MQTFKKFFKRADILLIISLCIICLILFLPKFISSNKSFNKTAVIYKDGDIINRITLDSVEKKYDLNLNCDPKVTLQVNNGRIRYKSSQCHDKLCVKCGWLSDVGDTAVCLPSRTMIVIEGTASKDTPDAISY